MNIFIVSKFGDSIDLAEKLASEDNVVSVYVREKNIIVQNNLCTITRNPTAEMIKSELIIVEDDKSGEFSERARKLKRPLLGNGKIVDKLISDSKYGTEVLVGCGLPLSKETTKGMGVGVGGWFVGESFLKPYFLHFNYTKFGSGDIGPHIGPMGIVGMYKLRGKIFRESLLKLETYLKSISYVGYVGLDLLINDESLLVSGWNIGFEFPIINVMSFMHTNFSKFLFKLAIGTAKTTAVQPDIVGVGITWLELNWLYKKPLTNRPKIISEVGMSIDEARSKVYKQIHKTLMKDEYYRVDIGLTTRYNMERLVDNGWL